jgi:hypothetical protein
VVVSPQLGIVEERSANATDDEVLRLVRGLVAARGFAFPAVPVRVGETFATGGQVAARVRVAAETGLAIDETLRADVALTLDSVVAVQSDTLAYLRFGGTFPATTRASEDETGSREETFSGGFAGQLIWSQGWSAFVSGAARVRVEGLVRAQTPGGVVNARGIWDTTILHQVRP